MSPLPLPINPSIVAHWAGAPFQPLPTGPALIALAHPADWHSWQTAEVPPSQGHWLVLGPHLLGSGFRPPAGIHRWGIYTCLNTHYSPRLPLPYHPHGLTALRRLSLLTQGRSFLLTDVAGITDGPLWAELASSLGVQVLVAGPPQPAQAWLQLLENHP